MRIQKQKCDRIRQAYIGGRPNVRGLVEELNLKKGTVTYYLNEFRLLEAAEPGKLADFAYFPSKGKVTRPTPWSPGFDRVMRELVLDEPGPQLNGTRLYDAYHRCLPDEYSRPRFYYLFRRWFDQNQQELSELKIRQKFNTEELATLQKWRKGNDRRLWQVAVVLLTAYTYYDFGELCTRIECSKTSVLKWTRLYKQQGFAALSRPGSKRPYTKKRIAAREKKMDDLVHLVRQSPKNYSIDKAYWTISDLTDAYHRHAGVALSYSAVRTYLRSRGIRCKRSREVIVSNDPLYQEKYEHIQQILGSLGENEKFFSIDEYGPKSVRPQGGRMLVQKGEKAIYRKVDKGKGWFICTCALELSTNQLCWFYSRQKNTNEMIKLIDVLTLQYQEQERLYLSWDAASWHDSRELHDYLAEINEPEYRAKLKTPEVIIVPLPAKAPHLNVIESIFSGMARSVIHNSDYETVECCTAAIDRYFNRRNDHFLNNPKRAGDKIWGKEKVKPVFHKANICRPVG